ncbi:glycerophosphoryl diester phosphodiesterase [Endozoicomonas sp. OPT23]|uniref:glycerophosphodiester phosphodiesterase family protein n=1 Tax=Endozoicomonas sp. OPT23 TaxID=2072845 RepID=UPI00129B9025|nr:glycerophosphodiester phosphodiesterase family protein [Endozoicomonas sp. OPT23]MRI34136.1 glycerophosphoryl diester phosphodiesterase [Endozoicomonas sp. OPT23]
MIMEPVIGHRGVAALAPENTLSSIRKAAEQGVKWIELDVTLLGDGSAVMFHDARINRTTSGTGHLRNTDIEMLRQLDAGSWFGSEFAGEKVPTLKEALELIKELNLSLNLELKPNRCNLKQLAVTVTETLAETKFPEENLLVSSFNHKALVLFRNRSSVRVSCLYESLPLNWRHKAKQVNASAIHLNGGRVTGKKAANVKAEGYELYCYTVNDSQQAKRLKALGVNGVFSDNPALIRG